MTASHPTITYVGSGSDTLAKFGRVETTPAELDDSHIGLWVRVLGADEPSGFLRSITNNLIAGQGLVLDLELDPGDGEITTLRLKRYSTWRGWLAEADARTVLLYPTLCANCDQPITKTVVAKTRTSQILGWAHVRLPAGRAQACRPDDQGSLSAEPQVAE